MAAKTRWLSHMPQAEEGQQAANVSTLPAAGVRFDLLGRLVAAGAKVAEHQGLHHHGAEPERPGYTVEELCVSPLSFMHHPIYTFVLFSSR